MVGRPTPVAAPAINYASVGRVTKAKLHRGAWNKGRTVGQKAPFSPAQVQLIRNLLENELDRAAGAAARPSGRAAHVRAARDLALFETAISTMLRACDLLTLRRTDVSDHRGVVLEQVALRQAKTGQPHVVELGRRARPALARWLELSAKSGAEALFTNCRTARPGAGRPISRVRYAGLVKAWARMARLDPAAYATHSTRRTKSAAVYAQTRDVAACQQLLGHRSIGATGRYLGIDRARAFDLARLVDL